MSTDPSTRKSIAQRAIDRAKAHGVPIDKDPAFIALLDEWVRGEIDIKQMRERYLDSLALQEAEQRGRLARRRARPEPSEA
ncbi:hypothetical protein SAMN05216228_104627 [Rhizobium tibeticum]|uniref:Antitoxin VbhA domain-containing protein n=1 Tax=Rhizobium tibeticum TaxID=501024 RepID=A0A1H8VRN4_9HYPH|nr:hypothetical protein [Rhizobium tibeticum]SEI19444.1 hypothetical protein RTCCBAU85039_6156 [Rhizobium tibeticum]SEP17984.1 hypothetical protein SAMN05216228_104627 [Rhizobium tibeticum]